MNKSVVALLNGETIQSLSMAAQLKKSGYEVGVICDSMQSYGFNNKHADWKIVAPSIHEDQENFHKFFVDFLKYKQVNVVIPMNDFSAEYLSMNKNELRDLTNFLIPDYDVFLDGYDKNRLMRVCEVNHFPHPKTIDLSTTSIEEAAGKMVFPALIKPNITTGGRGFAKVNNGEDLKQKYPLIYQEYGHCHLQEFVPAGGRQFKVELFIDENGSLINSTVLHKVRFYPENGGSSCCSISVDEPNLVKICADVLKAIRWIGFADFDLIEDPRSGEFKIMEINPRVPACVRLSLVSGIDFATLIADATLQKGLKHYTYAPGKILRYMALDSLWFAYSNRRFKTNPSWFKFFGKNIYWQECGGGLKAMIKGSLAGLSKQLSPQFRESKAGLR